ncbi:MAG: TolC family protein [Curvibacter sp.]|nr:MAG: TolC family protein [Curvibacter sp.]
MTRPESHPRHLLVLALWTALSLPAGAETPPGTTHTDPGATLASVALPWAGQLQNVLPPEERVRAMLLRQPTVQAARANVEAAAGRQARLNAGPHEWTFKAGAQQRREMPGPRYRESEFAVERGLRLPAKLDADQALGRNEAEVGMLAFEDTWHESARTLLKAWFDALREARTQQTLREQVALAEQQRSVAQRRLQAGEAARLELLQAEADVGRAQAAAQQSSTRLRALQADLRLRYPDVQGLLEPTSSGLPAPAGLSESAQHWVERVLADNHELELAEAQARHAELVARRAGLERQGDPVLGVRASRERGGQEQVLGVYVSVPWGGAGRRADEKTALAQAEIARQKVDEVRQRVGSEAWRVAINAVEGESSWQALEAAWQRMDQSARLAGRAYSLGELPLGEALQARRLALEARLNADAARLDILESQSRLLLDAHQMWTPPGHGD